MKKKNALQGFAVMAVAALVGITAGCSDSSTPSAPAATPVAVTGIAATGQAMIGKVTLKDANGAEPKNPADIQSDGSFSVDVTGMQAPYLLQATASNGQTKHYSFADGPGRANINPLSTAVVANAAKDDPANVFNAMDGTKLNNIKKRLVASTDRLNARLRTILMRYNAAGCDPIKGDFKIDKTGLDGFFEDIDIEVQNKIIRLLNKKNNNAECLNGKIDDDQVVGADTITETNLPPTPAAAPAAPTGLTATAGEGQNSISWSPVTGATSYNLYYSTTTPVTPMNGTLVSNVTSPYTHTGLTAGAPYYYTVTAANASGTGAAATEVTATPTAPPAPPATPTTPAPAPDGAALYSQICQSCHGALASSSKSGRSATQLTAAQSLSFHPPTFKSLTPAEISAIAIALGGAP